MYLFHTHKKITEADLQAFKLNLVIFNRPLDHNPTTMMEVPFCQAVKLNIQTAPPDKMKTKT